MKRALIACCLLSLAAPAIAEAPEAEPAAGWERLPDSFNRMVYREDGPAKSLSMSVISAAGSGARLLFNCQVTDRGEYSLSAGFESDPAKASAAEPKRNITPQKRKINLKIGETSSRITALYNAHTTRLMPFDKKYAKVLYNAVIEGKLVQFDMQGKTFAVSNPGLTPAFNTFAKACPVTNGGKVDQATVDAIAAYTGTNE